MASFDYAYLRKVLLTLPQVTSGEASPLVKDFRQYTPSSEGMERTESVNGTVNYDLENILGLKCNGLALGGGGPGLAALADLLERYTNEFPSDSVLALWGPAVLASAETVYTLANQSLPPSVQTAIDAERPPIANARCSPPVHGSKVAQVTRAQARLAPIFRNKRPSPSSAPRSNKLPSKKRKTKSSPRPKSSVPPWVDLTEEPADCGRPADPFLREISILCYDPTSENQVDKLRCCGSTNGCSKSWAWPRNRSRICKHVSECAFVDPSLRARALTCLSEDAPSVIAEQQLAPVGPSTASNNGASPSSATTGPSLHSLAKNLGRDQLKAVVDFAIVRFVCECGIPPTCVDRGSFKSLLSHLNSRYTPVSSSTLAHRHIPAEAALVTKKSVELLQQEVNLTLTLDGGSIRRSRSFYTFHVATPGRRIFLMRGEDTSTQSHTGEHIGSLALTVMEEIGLHRFAAVVTDGASNVTLGRSNIVERAPTVLNFSDPCHKISLLMKDSASIPEFKMGIHNLRRSIKFFSKSTYATAQLTERRKLLGIARGPKRIGRTRFGSVCIAAEAMLQCLPAIRELVAEGVFVVPDVNQLFIPNSPATIQFEMQLTVLTTLFTPLLRALTCLELSFSTPADVLLFFSAALGRLERLFSDGSHGLLEEISVARMRAYCNRRFNELINESPDDIYVVAFYLDPYHRNSKLLRNINPLSIKITLNPSNEFTSHGPTATMMKRIGASLITLLRKEWETHPNGPVRSMYPTGREAIDALRQQLLLYATSQYPFSEPIDDDTSAYTWWRNIACHPTAKLLAYFAIKLFSVVPNSMADERTVSTFTWLNSALRNRQDVATVVRQTQIRQYYGWDEVKHSKTPARIRFRDAHLRTEKQAAPSLSEEIDESAASPNNDNEDPEEFGEGADEWLDDDMVPLSAGDHVTTFLANDLIDLSAPELEDCIADAMPARLLEKRKDSAATSGTGTGPRQPQQKDVADTEWVF